MPRMAARWRGCSWRGGCGVPDSHSAAERPTTALFHELLRPDGKLDRTVPQRARVGWAPGLRRSVISEWRVPLVGLGLVPDSLLDRAPQARPRWLGPSRR